MSIFEFDPFPDCQGDVVVVLDENGRQHLYHDEPLCEDCRQLVEDRPDGYDSLRSEHRHTPADKWCWDCYENAHGQVQKWIGRPDAPIVDYEKMFPPE